MVTWWPSAALGFSAAIAGIWWWRRRAPALSYLAPERPGGEPVPAAEAAADLPSTVWDEPAPLRATPAPLAAFSLRLPADAPPAMLERIFQCLRRIPRPPRTLHQLVSVDFVTRASSAELADLVNGEPIVAAKVLARVNAPAHGIRTPVTGVGQAITFLGVWALRNICLRYLLDESFKADSPQARQAFERIGEACGLASELCARLAQKLQVPEAGALGTQVVLSFAGHQAAAILQFEQRVEDPDLAAAALLPRLRAQQAHFGLAAPELARLLMTEWRLPPAVVEDVASLDRSLLAPIGPAATAASARRALAYLSARLGERLAQGEMTDPGQVDALLNTDPDFHFLPAAMAPELWVAVRQALRAPEVFRGLLPAAAV